MGSDRARVVASMFAAALLLSLAACAVRPGTAAPRTGDEIVIAGQFFHTGAPVVLWMDVGGYDAYRVERRFVPREAMDWEAAKGKIATPQRYGIRAAGLSEDEFERVRGGGWSLAALRERVDQLVLHYDVCGTSRECFRVLHDARGLSVHFMLDIDGTIYQTMDVKERAWHATIANDRSVGIEIANIGAYPDLAGSPLEKWYGEDESGRVRLTLPEIRGDGGVRTEGFVGYPERFVKGEIGGRELVMYDFTPEQYSSLQRLTDALCTVLPKIRRDCPRDESGLILTRTLTTEEFASFTGVLGHYHIQENKLDPGPAMQWDRVVGAKHRRK